MMNLRPLNLCPHVSDGFRMSERVSGGKSLTPDSTLIQLCPPLLSRVTLSMKKLLKVSVIPAAVFFIKVEAMKHVSLDSTCDVL